MPADTASTAQDLETAYKKPVLTGFLILLVPLTLYLGIRDLVYGSQGALFFFLFQSAVILAAWVLHIRNNYTGASHFTVFGVALAQVLDLAILGYHGRHSFYMVSLVNSLLLLGGGFLLTSLRPLAALACALWIFYLYFIAASISPAASWEPQLPLEIQLAVPTLGFLVFTFLALGSRKIFDGIIRTQQVLLRESEEAHRGLGQLIRGMAHRLNTPLGNARMLLSAGSHLEGEHRALLSDSVDSSLGLINRLRTFLACSESRSGSKGSLSDQFSLLASAVPGPVFSTAALESVPGFKDIRTHHWDALHLILRELKSNAGLHSTPGSPWDVTFKTGADSALEFTFSNRAEGLKQEDLSKFLLPFFSTLNKSDHPGLGLYFAAHLVQKTLGGRILLDSPGKEIFRVTVRLPGSWREAAQSGQGT